MTKLRQKNTICPGHSASKRWSPGVGQAAPVSAEFGKGSGHKDRGLLSRCLQLCLRDEKETPVILREDPKLCKGILCGGGWLPGTGELWIDGETWKAGHASSQPAHFQGPSSRGSSTALSPWSHFPLCPPSSSSSGLKGDLHSQEEEKVLLIVAWGPIVSLGHLGSASMHRV